MLAINVLHSRGKLDTITVLLAEETKTLSDKVALKRSIWRVYKANLAEVQVLTRSAWIIIRVDTANVLNIRGGRCRDGSRAGQNREIISDERNARDARLWNCVRTLEVQST